jgi:hypothetical protein
VPGISARSSSPARARALAPPSGRIKALAIRFNRRCNCSGTSKQPYHKREFEVCDHGFFAASRLRVRPLPNESHSNTSVSFIRCFVRRSPGYHAKARSREVSFKFPAPPPSSPRPSARVSFFLQPGQLHRPGLELEGLGLCPGPISRTCSLCVSRRARGCACGLLRARASRASFRADIIRAFQ